MTTEITSKDKLPSPWLRTISKPASHPKVVPKAEAPIGEAEHEYREAAS